jgi:elongation factor P
MYETNQFRRGIKVEIDGDPYIMVDCQFVKPGKGQAFTRTKLKHLENGSVIDRTFKSGERVERAKLDEVAMQFLYAEGDAYHFMNTSNYEQVAIPKDQLGDAWMWLVENMEATVLFHAGKAISVDVPMFVELEITECEPGIKGDTRSASTKPAILVTGAKINVPLFVEQGEWIKVDTRTGEYVERVKR